MTRQQDRPILIIGAGLSGLTTARILTNHGVPNLVFEASNQDRSQGFSISLREWGYTALLDGLDGIPVTSLTRGVAPDRHIGGNGWIDQALRDNTSGELLVSPDPNNKQSIVRANRDALRDWIIDAGDEELDIRYGHKLKSFRGEVGDMVAEFENGARYSGSLIVAADGVHSTVRSKLLPKIVPEIVPVVVYHGEFVLARQDYDRLIKPLSGESNILAGVGDGFNTPITVCNMTASKVHMDWSYSRPVNGDNDPLYRPHVSTEEAKQIPEALLDEIATRNLAEPWSVFLNEEAMRKHHVFHWTSRCVFTKLEDVQQAAGSGVVFVGDSWHAMPIFGGEGGNHAIVDGVELANMLIEQRDICEGVSRYYDVAFRRCSDAVRRSRQRFYQLHRPMSEWREIIEKMAR